MKKILAIVLISFSLAGCATFEKVGAAISAAQNFSVTQGQLDSARNSYNGFVLAPLHKYSLLPRCKTGEKLTLNNPCHDRKLLKQIRAVDKQVDQAFADTQNRITSGDSQGAAAAYSTLMSVIEVAKTLINQTGIAVLGG